MPVQIVASSPKAKEVAETKREQRAEMYPFDQLEIGQSFTVPLDECNWKSLRIIVYKRNAKYKGEREFSFLKHDDLNLVEVARIA
uniref:Uncharacterized protein n=1 Tax=Stenotrophomonas phage vB_SmaS_QH3 TaxID=3229738 RepID=A0AAU7YTV7_9CAUD